MKQMKKEEDKNQGERRKKPGQEDSPEGW